MNLSTEFSLKVSGRNALAISRVSFAGIFGETEGRINRIAASFGAVYGIVLRFKDIEEMMLGKTLSEAGKAYGEYLAMYDERISKLLPPDRVSEEYRVAVCMNLLKVFLEKFGLTGEDRKMS